MSALNLPQPDFHVLSGHLQGMAIQVDRCSNLVAVQNTTVILDAVARLANSVDRLTTSVSQLSNEMQTMRTEMQTMRTDMQTMRTEMQTMRTDLRREMQTMGTDLRREMQAMGTDLRREMQTMGTELREEMQTMGTELREEMQAMGRSLELRMDDMSVEQTPDDVKKCLEAFDQVPMASAIEKKAQLKEYLGLCGAVDKIVRCAKSPLITDVPDIYLFFGLSVAAIVYGLVSFARALKVVSTPDSISSIDCVIKVYREATKHRCKKVDVAYSGVGILGKKLETPFKAVFLVGAAHDLVAAAWHGNGELDDSQVDADADADTDADAAADLDANAEATGHNLPTLPLSDDDDAGSPDDLLLGEEEA
ncbi:hypothetical protein EKO27_g2646 [Xylaria grammica]|uniref:Uncharacterized protein n=1 Tax=Xylaria grammica TaxID=363999 RepID=A0A439DDK4_9PEZI|nr:hypothetical protein EKO27_g2646 [Xylaria grammica]